MAEDITFRNSYMEGISRFNNARSRAFWQEAMSLLRNQSTELLSFDEVRARLRLREESYRGLQDIEIEKIRGSVGRYRNFTSTFLPKSGKMKERWSRVYASVNSMQGVPPIEVYKVGDVYFVRDGNHRVSVARHIGASTIEAHVTELHSPVWLDAATTIEDLDSAASYVAFLAETGLEQTRPHHQSMELSEPSRYPELLGHIYLHAQVMEHLLGNPVSMMEAAADWYDNLYRPAVTLIRKHHVLDRTGEHKKRTECDLYLWLVDHLRDIRQQYDEDGELSTSFSEALVDYLKERKIPVPEDLHDEDDDSVILSRSEAMRAVQRQQQKIQERAEESDIE